jgi:hypothetical protein
VNQIKFNVILCLILISQISFAEGGSCRNLFESSTSPVQVTGLHDKLPEIETAELIEKVKLLSEKLLAENKIALSYGEWGFNEAFAEATKITVKTIEQRAPGTEFSHFGTYKCDVEIEGPTGIEYDYIFIRSNGKVAFLDSTWKYRKNKVIVVKKYKTVYFENDKIKSADQGETILNSLPEKFQMSRNMSSKERDNWVNEKPYFPSPSYGNRVHFMPNKSRFQKNWEPYYIQMSKKDLLEFYHRGEVEINVYESTHNMDLTDIKLHFEIVFMGDKGIENLAPYMKSQLADQDKRDYDYSR